MGIGNRTEYLYTYKLPKFQVKNHSYKYSELEISKLLAVDSDRIVDFFTLPHIHEHKWNNHVSVELIIPTIAKGHNKKNQYK